MHVTICELARQSGLCENYQSLTLKQISNRCHGHKIGVKGSISLGKKHKPPDLNTTVQFRVLIPFKPHTHKNIQVYLRVSASVTMSLSRTESQSLVFLHTTK